MGRKIRCSKCGHVGPEEEFPKGYDFFQIPYVSSCPMKCGNIQSPGEASMRMMGGERPFVYVSDEPEPTDPLGKTLRQAKEAS